MTPRRFQQIVNLIFVWHDGSRRRHSRNYQNAGYAIEKKAKLSAFQVPERERTTLSRAYGSSLLELEIYRREHSTHPFSDALAPPLQLDISGENLQEENGKRADRVTRKNTHVMRRTTFPTLLIIEDGKKLERV